MTVFDLERGEAPGKTMAGLLEVLPWQSIVREGYNYSDRLGSIGLREAFLGKLATFATVPTEVMVSHGALGAIDSVVRRWQRHGSRLFVMSPTYREALSIARYHGLPVIEMNDAFDQSGSDSHDRMGSNDIVYVVPSLNNPDGRSMNEEERARLANLVVTSGSSLVEDDAYGLLAPNASASSIAGRVLDVHPTHRAVRLVSFSKTVMPGARCCVIESSAPVISELSEAKLDFGTCPLASEMVAALLRNEECWSAALTAVRTRLGLALGSGLTAMSEWPLALIDPGGGYFLWLPLGSVSARSFAATSLERLDIRVGVGDPFFAGETPPSFARLSIAWETNDRVEAACSRLCDFWSGVVR